MTSERQARAWCAAWLPCVALIASSLCAPSRAAEAAAGARAQDFFQNPHVTGAALSPDGQAVAISLAPTPTDRVRLLVMDLRTMKPTVVAQFADEDVVDARWVNEHRLVFGVQDRQAAPADLHGGAGLYGVNVDGRYFRQLARQRWTSFVHGADQRELLPPTTRLLAVADHGDDVFVVHPQDFDGKQADRPLVQRLDTLTGRTADVETPPHSFGWVFDAHGELRVVTTRAEGRARVLARDRASSAWSTLAEFDLFGSTQGFEPRFMDESGRLFVTAYGGGDTSAIYTYDLARHEMSATPFLRSPRYDLSPVPVAAGGHLLGLRYDIDAPVTHWLDPRMAALQDKIDAMLPTTVNRIAPAAHGDGRFVLVSAASDRVPGLFFVYDVTDDKLVTLGNAHPEIDPRQMSPMEAVHYPARDGLDIPAWLSVPRAAPRKDLPLVVLVHGGPWSRGQVWGWNPEVQFLAALGYAVLEPEFRGSTGYGARLFTAGFKQWGRAMQDDIADGVEWAVAQGLVDRKRVCIAGASYGGYAVLMGLVNDPAVYRCGVDWVGVTDIDLMYSVGWSDLSDTWKQYGMPRMIGDRVADAAQLQATSPIANAAKIRAPLLLAYGGKDLRVPRVHGEKLRDALLQARRTPVAGAASAVASAAAADPQWILYDQEGHGWRDVATRVDFWNRVAKFLAENLGQP